MSSLAEVLLNNGNEAKKRIPCTLYGCKRVYSDMASFDLHITNHQVPSQSLAGKVFLCTTMGCSGSFPNMQKLIEHTRQHHKPNIFFLCENCRAKLRSYRGLLTHLHTCSKVPRGKTKATEPMDTQRPLEAKPSTSPSPADPASSSSSGGADQNTPPTQDSASASLHGPPAESGSTPPSQPDPPAAPPAANPRKPSSAKTSLKQAAVAAARAQPLAPYPPPSLGLDAQTMAPGPPQPQVQPDPQGLPPQGLPPQPPQGQLPQLQARSPPAVHPAPGSSPPSAHGSTAVWRKNQGVSNSRILWEHTRGQYRCLQCHHSVSTRREMTSHINSHHRNPPPSQPAGDTGEPLGVAYPLGQTGPALRGTAGPEEREGEGVEASEEDQTKPDLTASGHLHNPSFPGSSRPHPSENLSSWSHPSENLSSRPHPSEPLSSWSHPSDPLSSWSHPPEPLSSAWSHPPEPHSSWSHPSEPLSSWSHPPEPLSSSWSHPSEPLSSSWSHPPEPLPPRPHPSEPLPPRPHPSEPLPPRPHPPEPLSSSVLASASRRVIDVPDPSGIIRVDRLAEYLVELRHNRVLALSDQQVSSIVALWQNMAVPDQQGALFAARYQSRLDTGRYKSPKKRLQDFTPDEEGDAATPPHTQRPDCCRLLETLFLRLCNVHGGPKKKGAVMVSRWDLVMDDYRRIRRRLLANGTVTQETSLQLAEVSHASLEQWYDDRAGRRTGPAPRPPPLPPANAHLPPQPGPAHQSPPPPPSQVQLKRKLPPLPVETTPQAVRPSSQQELLHAPPPVAAPPPQALDVSLSFALPAPPAPPPPAAKRSRKVHNTCKKCGDFKTSATGHSQFKGIVYCPAMEVVPKEQWLDNLRKQSQQQ